MLTLKMIYKILK